MAYAMNTEQSNPLFATAKNAVKLLQIFCMFHAFFGLVYWTLYTSNIESIQNFYWIFRPVWDFVKIFYTFSPGNNPDAIDFTGIIASIAMIGLSNAFKNLYEVVEDNEMKYKNFQLKQAEKKAKKQQKTTTTVIRGASKELIEFIFILDIQVSSVSGFHNEKEITNEEAEKLKTKFYEALIDNLNKNQIKQKGLFNKRLFLIYKDFNYIDNFIFYTKETLNSLSREFSRPNIKIDFTVGLSKLYATDNLNEEINIVDTIICLNIKNEFVCSAAFKLNYDRKEKRQYRLVTKGIYNLSKNLNVSNNQEIYSIKEIT